MFKKNVGPVEATRKFSVHFLCSMRMYVVRFSKYVQPQILLSGCFEKECNYNFDSFRKWSFDFKLKQT